MSAANPASTQVRRTAAAAPSRSAPSPQSMRQPAGAALALAASAREDELKLNLRDIPHVENELEVEGFKPSILSRLLDLFSPLHK